MIGSAFVYSEHGNGSSIPKPPSELTVYATDPSHPIMNGVDEEFALKEEFFQLMRPARNGDIGHEIAAAEDPRESQREPVAIVLERGDGRVFHLYLGHFLNTHFDTNYQKMLIQGVEWVAGDTTRNDTVVARVSSWF